MRQARLNASFCFMVQGRPRQRKGWALANPTTMQKAGGIMVQGRPRQRKGWALANPTTMHKAGGIMVQGRPRQRWDGR